MNHENKNVTIDLYGDGIGRLQLVQSMGSDATVVRSARVSFGKDEQGDALTDRDKKLIRYLIRHKHTSTLEHCNVTFKCVVPLFIRSQHHRHRTWSYNEISRRYTDENLQFYEPSEFRTQHESNRQASKNELINPKIVMVNDNLLTASELVRQHNLASVNLYNSLMEAGVCREQARGVLPQNLYTEYYASSCLGNILKFVDLRTHDGAQWEIQQLANAMLKILEDLYPETISAYKEIRSQSKS
jgi:thymidylate synthase (FAD)